MSRHARASRRAPLPARSHPLSSRKGRHARPTRLPRLALTLACSFAGTTTATLVATSGTYAQAATMGDDAVAYASLFAGRPYVYGASGPSSFDCSGYTAYVYAHFGVALPHSSSGQYSVVPHVAQADKLPGDLLFFESGGSIYHVGIYAGGNAMWAAPHTGDVVRLESIYSSSYYVGRPWQAAAPLSPDNQAILQHWSALGGAAGVLGPQAGGYARIPAGGAYVDFSSGAITSDGNGGNVHETHGPIRIAWAGLGFERSALGFPTSDVSPSADGVGLYSNFQGGAISWSPTSGAHETHGPVRTAWASSGYEYGALGYPTSDVTASVDGKGVYSNFQGGAISWSPASGAHATRGAVRLAWAQSGYEFGRLGYPTGEQVQVSPQVVQQSFQHGTIRVNSASGKTYVRYT